MTKDNDEKEKGNNMYSVVSLSLSLFRVLNALTTVHLCS